MSSSPRPLALDFGRVLTLDPDPSPFADLLAQAGFDAPAFHRAYALGRHPFDRGDLTPEAYWTGLQAGLRPDEAPEVRRARVQALADADFATWARPRTALHALVQGALDRGTPTAIVSNMPLGVGDRFVRTWPWLARIPHRFFSAELHLAKPEPAFYRHVLAQTGWRAPEVLFVDDLPANVEAAGAEGFSTLLFTGSDDDLARIAAWTEAPGRGR